MKYLWQSVVVVYLIWWSVGLVMLSANISGLMGYWEDLIFMLLASGVLALWLVHKAGGKVTAWAFVCVALISGVLEGVGATTGYPFGEYTYTERFGPRLGGLLPFSIPLAWWVIVMPVYLFIRRCYPNIMKPLQRLSLAVLCGAGAMVVDFALEPVAWRLREYWLWSDGQFYFGVPLLNFFGWWLTAGIIAWGLSFLRLERLFDRAVSGKESALLLPMLILASVLVPFALSAILQWSSIPGAALVIVLVLSFPAWVIVRLVRPSRADWVKLWQLK